MMFEVTNPLTKLIIITDNYADAVVIATNNNVLIGKPIKIIK